ncbi:ABC transporter permease [Entomobacter blattae]|uniref:Putative iron export permease protein FetB n=1 Tax=Entomobacter blattae TaxID=2762277 RepID=A0A7H1NP16_9PROT|nr:ABC transporter permease [Entomobacter blattae]QNT77526.1 putative iron export permease protein FetB [Entomobacter blattae]
MLSVTDMFLVSGIVLLCSLCSLWLSLNIHKPLIVAALRMVLQLMLVGYVLKIIFKVASPWFVVGFLTIMVGAATYEIASRQEKGINHFWLYGIGGSSIIFSAGVIAVLGVGVTLRPSPWYAPEQVIPFCAIILGNAMNGASISLKAMIQTVQRERAAIEAQLCLGYPYFYVMRQYMRAAQQLALIPTINTMAAAGIVTMPGIMTGQLLAGADPLVAAHYQIVLMSLVFGGVFLCSLMCVWGVSYRITDSRQRLRIDHILKKT